MVRSVALHMTHWPYAFALRDGVFCGLDTSEDLTGLWSGLPLGHHIATVLILTKPVCRGKRWHGAYCDAKHVLAPLSKKAPTFSIHRELDVAVCAR